MKKVGSIVLTIYLTLVTVACGLFGYLYFSTRLSDKGITLDRFSAKVLVDTVCEDLGIKVDKGSALASSDAFVLDDVKKDLDVIQQGYSGLAEQMVIYGKSILDSDAEENVLYKTSDDDNMSTRQRCCTFSISGNKMYFSLWLIDTSDEGQHEVERQWAARVVFERASSGWNVTAYIVMASSNLFDMSEVTLTGTDGKGFESVSTAHAAFKSTENVFPSSLKNSDLTSLTGYMGYKANETTQQRNFEIKESSEEHIKTEKNINYYEVVDDGKLLTLSNSLLNNLKVCEYDNAKNKIDSASDKQTNFWKLNEQYMKSLVPQQ